LAKIVDSYTGHTVRLRRSDGTQLDFYPSNLGLRSGSGLSLAKWAPSDTAVNVITWYEQSGSGRTATGDFAGGSAPKITIGSEGVVYLPYGTHMTLPGGTLPYGSNTPYSLVAKHGAVGKTSQSAIISAGVTTIVTGGTNALLIDIWGTTG
jgi:hypothetical protein